MHMKRILFIAFLCFATFCIAHAENTDKHLKQLVQCINDSDFVCAAEQLPLVENTEWNTSYALPDTNAMSRFMEYLVANERYDASIIVAQQLIKIYEKEALVNTNGYIHTLVVLGNQYLQAGQYPSAIQYLNEALTRQQTILGSDHYDCLNTLKIIGETYRAMADYERAEQCYLQMLNTIETSVSTTCDDYAITLNNLGYLYKDQGRYSEAIRTLQQAIDILNNNYQPLKSISPLNNLGLVYTEIDDYKHAEECFKRAIKIHKDHIGESDRTMATYYNNLGLLYTEIGKYHEAEIYILKTEQIFRQLLGEKHPDYAVVINNLALLYQKMDEYNQAEQRFLQVLDIFKESIGELHPKYILATCNIGRFYNVIGDYEKAEKAYLKVLQLCEATSMTEHPRYGLYTHNLGVLYLDSHKYAEAEKYIKESVRIRKNIYGEHSYDHANSLLSLGSLYERTGNYTKAKEIYDQVTEMAINLFDDQSLFYAKAICHLGSLQEISDNYLAAEQYYLQALDIFRKKWGENNSQYLVVSSCLGRVYDEIQDYAQAITYLKFVTQYHENLYIHSIEYMSEFQRKSFWEKRKYTFEQGFPRVLYKASFSQLSVSGSAAYNNELFIKGLLLSSSNAIRQSVLNSNNPPLIRQWNELTEKKQQIMALEEKNPQMAYLAELREASETLEKEITRKSAAFRENMRQWNITWDSVRAALKPNQVAIEYMRAPLNEDSTMYCALLLRDTCSYPITIPLFEEKEVTQLIEVSTPSSISKAYSYRENGKELSRLVWSKVLPYINPGEIVFFAPTGLLHEVAMESIPYDSTQVISDVYNLVRLSSTRELAIHKPAISHKTATLYGGISYDVSADELLAQSAAYPSLASRSVINDTINRGRVRYLPGTKSEIEGIQKALSDKEIRVQAYTASAANEESFKALSGTKQNILHVATHGFYWADSTNIDPMERSGLLLAGANIALSGHRERLPEGIEDGVLTAKEISTLDLREADIVVLSACETAQGVITGEGVFGLQRAFKMAGAQTLLMAIWPVSDEATQLLMNFFYRYYSQGMSKRQAFRMAQQEVRNYTADDTSSESRGTSGKEKMLNKGKMGDSSHAPQPPKGGAASLEGANPHPYASPYYWAGFILLD